MLQVFAAAMGACDLARIAVGNVEKLGELLVAIAAIEDVLGHDLVSSENMIARIGSARRRKAARRKFGKRGSEMTNTASGMSNRLRGAGRRGAAWGSPRPRREAM